MKLLWESTNGWGITQQEDLTGEIFYSVYRFYPIEGWVPYKTIGKCPASCFIWLGRGHFISNDEMLLQIEKLRKDCIHGKEPSCPVSPKI